MMLGSVGTFSMQQAKALTSGEGGAVITDDLAGYNMMQQLRAGCRMHVKTEPSVGQMELEEVGDIQGRNMWLIEWLNT